MVSNHVVGLHLYFNINDEKVNLLSSLPHLRLLLSLKSSMTSISQLSNLIYLNISTNYQEGIPSGIGCLTKLRDLSLFNFHHQGLSYLKSQILSFNSGPIPNEISNLANLSCLDLDDNQFTGYPFQNISLFSNNKNQVKFLLGWEI